MRLGICVLFWVVCFVGVGSVDVLNSMVWDGCCCVMLMRLLMLEGLGCVWFKFVRCWVSLME